MKRTLLYLFTVILFVCFFFSCLNKKKAEDDSIPLSTFFNNVEKKFPDLMKIKFSYYCKLLNTYNYSKDSTSTSIEYDKNMEFKIYNDDLKRYCVESELPKDYFKKFLEVKEICDEIKLNEIFFNHHFKIIEFVFDLKYVDSKTIPKWDQRNDSKKDRYVGIFRYDINSSYDKDTNQFRIKNYWYFSYGIERAD